MDQSETATTRNKATRVGDWAEVQRRLELARLAIERGAAKTPEEKKNILQARAKLLARERERQSDGESLDVVEFLLAYEHYAIESSSVREVYPLTELAPLPGVPSAVLGVTSVRGQIISVIDLKKFFGLPEKGLTDLNKVIIIRNDAIELGILADAILGVCSIALAKIQPPLSTLTGTRTQYLKGVTAERLVILDAAKLLADQGLAPGEGTK